MLKQLLSLSLLICVACSSPSKSEENENNATDNNPSTTTIQAVHLPVLPDKMEFAGEEIDLTDSDIRERLDREILTNAYFQSATTAYLKRATRFFPNIEKVLKEEGIPDDFKYLAVIESGLVQAVSPAGAEGFWQFMPTTGKLYGLKMTPEIDERLNIEKSTHAACQYLNDAHRTLNDWVMTTASYNRGVAGVQRDMEWQGTEHYFDTEQNSETGRYVFRLLAIKLIFENPEAYGFFPSEMECYKPYKTQKITLKESIPNIAEWAVEQGYNLKIFRKLNPWVLGNKLTIKKGQFIQIELPRETERLKPYKEYLR